ncbi:hypothetical protein [Equine adenovirus 1]|uniref:Uncharacterized protein n=1 Tax=Equine adenovirus A serotype 1 TaxID=46916 RepID=A0A1B0XBB7_ADEE1|nr:hypothetical protein [Equine adenovirus 1]
MHASHVKHFEQNIQEGGLIHVIHLEGHVERVGGVSVQEVLTQVGERSHGHEVGGEGNAPERAVTQELFLRDGGHCGSSDEGIRPVRGVRVPFSGVRAGYGAGKAGVVMLIGHSDGVVVFVVLHIHHLPTHGLEISQEGVEAVFVTLWQVVALVADVIVGQHLNHEPILGHVGLAHVVALAVHVPLDFELVRSQQAVVSGPGDGGVKHDGDSPEGVTEVEGAIQVGDGAGVGKVGVEGRAQRRRLVLLDARKAPAAEAGPVPCGDGDGHVGGVGRNGVQHVGGGQVVRERLVVHVVSQHGFQSGGCVVRQGEEARIEVDALYANAGTVHAKVVSQGALQDHVHIFSKRPLVRVCPRKQEQIFDRKKLLRDLNMELTVAPIPQQLRPVPQSGISVVVERVNSIHHIRRPFSTDIHIGVNQISDRQTHVHVSVGIVVGGLHRVLGCVFEFVGQVQGHVRVEKPLKQVGIEVDFHSFHIAKGYTMLTVSILVVGLKGIPLSIHSHGKHVFKRPHATQRVAIIR